MTAIEWTDETWNPVTGCDRVSPGCDHCYAERIAKRFGGPEGFRVELQPHRLDAPLHWRKPRRVFVNSMSDLFHPDVPDEFIARVFGIMGAAERHTFQILTKRPQRMAALLNDAEFIRSVQSKWWTRWFMLLDSPDTTYTRRADDVPRPLKIDNRRARSVVWAKSRRSMPLGSQNLAYPLPNVWLGVSVENQRYADMRIPLLLRTPAAVRFLSVEPLLAPVTIEHWTMPCRHTGTHGTCQPSGLRSAIGWVIVGGESGPGARPMEHEWASAIRDECVIGQVPFFFKQWGGRTPKAGGRELDGRTWDEYPPGPEPRWRDEHAAAEATG